MSEAQAKRIWEDAEKQRQAPVVAKIKQIADDRTVITSSWEKEFIRSILNQYAYGHKPLSQKQLEIVNRIIETYGWVTPEERTRVAQKSKSEELAIGADKMLMNDILNHLNLGYRDKSFVESLAQWVGNGRTLTEKQRAALKKVVVRYQRQARDITSLREFIGVSVADIESQARVEQYFARLGSTHDLGIIGTVQLEARKDPILNAAHKSSVEERCISLWNRAVQ